MSFYDDFIAGLRATVDRDFGGKRSHFAAHARTHPSTLSRILDGERSTWLHSICRMADSAGMTLAFKNSEQAREVCFVDARVVGAGGQLSPPEAEDYLAVPLVDEVGAGPGLIPQEELLSWFLVWRWQEAVRHRSDLVAVRIAKNSNSMLPTLCPGDIVLVDRADKNISYPGRMWLVMEPDDGAGKIKRVAVQPLPETRDHRITFYSDNTAEYPPEVYSLKDDFQSDWNRCVAGRVIWAWSDISQK